MFSTFGSFSSGSFGDSGGSDSFTANSSDLEPCNTLFVGDLSYFCTEEDLQVLFSSFGRVMTAHIRRGINGESLMHGFVGLDSHEGAVKAVQELHCALFMGRAVRVQLANDKDRPDPTVKESYVQLHVSFISKQTHFFISEQILREIFTSFGRVADVCVKKHSMTAQRQSGYGFVYYFDVDSATHAQAMLKGNQVNDITFDCSVSFKSQHGKSSPPMFKEWDVHNSLPPFPNTSNSHHAMSRVQRHGFGDRFGGFNPPPMVPTSHPQQRIGSHAHDFSPQSTTTVFSLQHQMSGAHNQRVNTQSIHHGVNRVPNFTQGRMQNGVFHDRTIAPALLTTSNSAVPNHHVLPRSAAHGHSSVHLGHHGVLNLDQHDFHYGTMPPH